ncbi:MAG: YtxH domain-containing protein [Acidimicrobiales bacterium]
MSNRDTYNRWTKRALFAFPPRWREAHGAELLDVSRALAADSSNRPPTSELMDIVRGGLAVRLRDRPSFGLRMRYRWLDQPVPTIWHDWMHDDLSSRLVGLRALLRPLPIQLVSWALISRSSWGWPPVFALIAIFATTALLFAPYKARRLRRQISKKVGYDVMSGGGASPPKQTAEVRPVAPTPRVPIDSYGLPIAFWALLAGVSLIAGAALPNDLRLSFSRFSVVADPNSPLTAVQVLAISAGFVVLAAALATTAYRFGMARAQQLPNYTIHPQASGTSQRFWWFLATLVGVSATTVGALGVAPDQACVAIGAFLAIAGSLALTILRIDTIHSLLLGRHISVAELLVGEGPVPATQLHPTRR